MHEGFWSSDGANVGIAGRTLFCDDVLQQTCRMDRMGRMGPQMQWPLSLTPLPRKSTIPCRATGAVRDQPPETHSAGMALSRGDPESPVELTGSLP